MAGEDPSKRCFHCVFTNKPGADGGIGIITPDLLASLFAPLERSSKKMKRHHHHHRRSKKQKRKEAEKVLSDQTKSEVGDIPEAISPMSQTDPKQSDSDEMETTMLGREAESV